MPSEEISEPEDAIAENDASARDENITIDYSCYSNLPDVVNVYSVKADYNSIITEISMGSRTISGWESGTGSEDPLLCEPLFSPILIRNCFASEHGIDMDSMDFFYQLNNLSADDFWSYILENRVESVEFTGITDECIECMEAIGVCPEYYSDHVLHSTVPMPDGTRRDEYSIPSQIDGLPIVENSIYPQNSTSLGLVKWNDYVGFAGGPNLNGISYISHFVNENRVGCTIDLHDYEVLDILASGLSVLSVDDCTDNIREAITSDVNISTNDRVYVYLADLCYVSILEYDTTDDRYTGNIYLVPCWVFFYTAFDGIIDRGPMDGLIVFNAVTGDNININGTEYGYIVD